VYSVVIQPNAALHALLGSSCRLSAMLMYHSCSHMLQIPELSSKLPLPIDVLLDVSWIARKAHESIKGIKVRTG
jgi:hypothetical protein